VSKKIVIVNVHWNNRGDEAALKGLWLNLRKKFPSSKITTIFKNKNPINDGLNLFTDKILVNNFKEPLFKIIFCILFRGKIFKNSDVSKLIRALLNADFIIYGPGGSVISDNFYRYKQIEYLTPFAVSFFFSIPLYVIGPSFGPFDLSKKFLVRKFLISKAKKICVREEHSKNSLLTLDKNIKVVSTTDLCFSYQDFNYIKNKKFEKILHKFKFLENGKKIVGITLTDFNWHVKIGKDLELIKNLNIIYHNFIEYLVENNFKVLLIPQLFGSQNDYDYLNKFKSISDNVETLSVKFDCDEQKKIISKLYAFVGVRYHSNIFAIMSKVPNVSIIYENKMEGFLKDSGLENLGLNLYDLDTNKLIKKFKKLCINRDTTIKLYDKILPLLEKKSKSSFDLLNEDI